MAVIALACGAAGALGAEPEVKKEDLPRYPAVELKDAAGSMKVRPGFHVELAAGEPNVVDPIAMCFDEDGRLFVVEMRDYSERRMEKLGRIRMLEDRDGDGVYETSTVFLDGLPWPTALFWYKGGLLVGATPDIVYAKDTDGDGRADSVKTLFTGFGSTQEKLNVQGLFNNFVWGPDNRIHGCSGHDGGMITAAMHPEMPPLDVRGKGFVIDPRDWSITTEAGGGQYGLSFSSWGDLFTCENSSHLEMFTYDGARYGARNPYYVAPDPLVSVAADGPAAEVYRASPEEPWRVIRTRWRIAGLVGGPVEGGGRSAGYFTGATGVTMYTGNAFGPRYDFDAFVGDAGGNLVHHKHIVRKAGSVEPVGARPADEMKREFVASTDTWFRPVDFANAPDGCLYVADMYREVIEHPWSIPPNIKKFLDLNSGNDRGRIWRIAPDGYVLPKAPTMSKASTAELVGLLAHPNGWHRDAAARLLFERQDRSAVAPLVKMVGESKVAVGRLRALDALEGLGGLTDDVVVRAMGDADEHVRARAVRLSEELTRERKVSEGVWAAIGKAAGDGSAIVRHQVAFTLGQLDHAGREALLAGVVKRSPADEWVRAAVLTSLASGAGEVFAEVAGDEGVTASGFLRELAGVIGAQARDADVANVVRAVKGMDDARGLAVAGGLLAGAERAKRLDEVRPGMAEVFARASAGVEDAKAGGAAIGVLGYAPAAVGVPALLGVVDRGAESRKAAAVDALGRFEGEGAFEEVVGRWGKLSARVRGEAVAGWVKTPARAGRLVAAVKAGRVKEGDLGTVQVQRLLAYPDAGVRAAARAVLTPPAAQRTAVVEKYREAVSLSGDAARGHVIYAQRCVSCHRAGTEGFAVGPDLVTVKNGGREKNLVSVLDPSREVAANYVAYEVETKDGESYLGIIASDTPTTITVRQAYRKDVTIPRGNIRRMTSQGKSLMPDGLEEGMSPRDVADLLEFVANAGAPAGAGTAGRP